MSHAIFCLITVMNWRIMYLYIQINNIIYTKRCGYLVKIVPECTKCGSPVTDLVEPEVEEHGQVKRGRYINSVWICDDCIENEKEQEKL